LEPFARELSGLRSLLKIHQFMKSKSRFKSLSLAVAVAVVAPAITFAQNGLKFPAPSPNAKVTQTVGLTEVEVVYARPAMRGRAIFGELVPMNEIWRTGANAATKVSFDGPVVFGGTEVAAGTYALFSIPGEKQWEVILSSNTELWGSYEFDAKDAVARVKAKPVKLSSAVESLTISVDGVDADAATLNIAWENVRVPVKIVADTQAELLPKIEAMMKSDAEKKPYFQAAMYLYAKRANLAQAAEWITKAAEQQPDAPWVTYRQGLVLEAVGDHAGARAAAEKSLARAREMEGEISTEYVRLNETLLARLN
jgi:hypothetical protein